MKSWDLGVALLLALASGGLAHLYFLRLEAEVSGGPSIPVLVAGEDVAIGVSLTEKLLVVRDLPKAYTEARHVRASELKQVLGARLASGLRANEALLWTDLATWNGHARALSGLVESGMRAVSIQDRSADFEGLLRPGDRVDVLFSTGGRDDANGATDTLLQDLLVLSVGGRLTRADDDDKNRTTGWGVVLGASVEQAQVLTQAEQRGRLTLTLRNPEDITLVEDIPETTGADFGSAKSQVAPVSRTVVQRERIDHVR